MKNRRFLLSAMIAFALVLVCLVAFPTRAEAAVVNSGTCGENVTWTLDDEGLLTISGNGPMDDYSRTGPAHTDVPWNVSDVNGVIIESGVTTIGAYAFYNCSSLQSVSIADGVTTIGVCAFENCTGLTSVTIRRALLPLVPVPLQTAPACKM